MRFDHAYGEELPWPDDWFDHVVCAFVVHHLDKTTTRAVLAEVGRVLRPGGLLHLVDVGGDAEESLVRAELGPVDVVAEQRTPVLGRIRFLQVQTTAVSARG